MPRVDELVLLLNQVFRELRVRDGRLIGAGVPLRGGGGEERDDVRLDLRHEAAQLLHRAVQAAQLGERLVNLHYEK